MPRVKKDAGIVGMIDWKKRNIICTNGVGLDSSGTGDSTTIQTIIKPMTIAKWAKNERRPMKDHNQQIKNNRCRNKSSTVTHYHQNIFTDKNITCQPIGNRENYENSQ